MTQKCWALAALNPKSAGVLRDQAAISSELLVKFFFGFNNARLVYVLNYKEYSDHSSSQRGAFANKWVHSLFVLQNRVSGREDADKLVCFLAPQISQGKTKSFSHLTAKMVRATMVSLKVICIDSEIDCCACLCCGCDFKCLISMCSNNTLEG